MSAASLQNSLEADIPRALAHDAYAPDPCGLDRLSGDSWDPQVLDFADVALEQTNGLSRTRWADDEIHRVALRKDGNIKVASLLRTVQLPGTGVRMNISRYGPLWRQLGQAADPSYLPIFFNTLAADFACQSSELLMVFPRCEPDTNDAVPSALQSAGFKLMEPPGDRRRYFVNVTLTADELRASLSQKWRYHLKKSEESDLSFELADGGEAVERFVCMHKQMIARKGFSESGPIKELYDLVSTDEIELRPKIFFAAHRGVEVAGAVIDTSGELANYLLGATTDQALQLRAGYFLQWEILKYLSSLPTVRWYWLGGGPSKSSSLHQFKRGMVGKSGCVLSEPGAYYRSGSTYAAIVGQAAMRMRWLKAGLADGMRHLRKA